MSKENEQIKKDNRSPAQKLGDLEAAAGHLYNLVDHLGKDVGMIKSALKMLDNKLSALIKAQVQGETVSDAVLDRIMIENNVADLANKVTNLVVQGKVVAEDQVSDNSFIVGNEVDDDGSITNPRIQFPLKALSPELQTKLLGAKPGDKLKFKDGATVSFQVLETYKINALSPEEAAAEAPAEEAASAAPSDAPAAPAADPSTPSSGN